jgi:ribosomal protein S18 acetylase RimI-like enzyme
MGECDGKAELRRATAADARAIGTVHVRSWQRTYRGLVADEVSDALDVDKRERFWQRALEGPRQITPLLAVVDDRVVGFVSAGPCEDEDASRSTGQVYAIYLIAECWDRGLGRDLLQEAEVDLRLAGYKEGSLWVLKTNERARRFYEAAGWRPDGSEKTETFGGANLLEIRYRKPFS